MIAQFLTGIIFIVGGIVVILNIWKKDETKSNNPSI